jgi:hypothetical protein
MYVHTEITLKNGIDAEKAATEENKMDWRNGMKKMLFAVVLFCGMGSLYAYDYKGEYSIGTNAPPFRVFKSTRSMDAYRLMTDEIAETLKHNFLLLDVTPHQETPNMGADLINLFRRTGGDLLVSVVAGFNGPEMYMYYSSGGTYYIYQSTFLSGMKK